MANPVTKGMRQETQGLTRTYFVYFLSWGIFQPYINLHLKRIGLSGTEIGVLSALRPLTAIFVPPLVGYLADRYGRRRHMLAWILLGGVLSYVFILRASGFLAIIPGMLWFSIFNGPIVPMLDANALDALAGDRTKYGLMRRWGSLGYMLAVVITGQLGRYMPISFLLAISGGLLALAGWIALLHSRGETGNRSTAAAGQTAWWRELTASWRDIIRLPGMPVFFFAGLLGWTASSTYYNFFSILADDMGMSESLIGLAWGIAVTSEIVMLSLSVRLLQRLGAKGLFALGLTAAAIRWFLYSLVQNPYIILALQTLHGFTFGTLQAGAVTYLHAAVAPERRSGAQTLWGAVTAGVAGALGAYLMGPLSDILGLRPMFALSGLLAFAGALVGWLGLRQTGVGQAQN